MRKRKDDLGYLQIRRAPPAPRNILARRILWRHGIPERRCRRRGRALGACPSPGARLAGARRGLPRWYTQDGDLIATSPDGSVAVETQVKTATTNGKIRWQKPGREQVRRLSR